MREICGIVIISIGIQYFISRKGRVGWVAVHMDGAGLINGKLLRIFFLTIIVHRTILKAVISL